MHAVSTLARSPLWHCCWVESLCFASLRHIFESQTHSRAALALYRLCRCWRRSKWSSYLNQVCIGGPRATTSACTGLQGTANALYLIRASPWS